MNTHYSIENGELIVRDAGTSGLVWRGYLRAQRALKCACAPDTDDCILLVEAGTKDRPLFENLLRVRRNGEIVWSASTTGSHDWFVDFDFNSTALAAATWSCYRVGINLDTGKVTSEEFVK